MTDLNQTNCGNPDAYKGVNPPLTSGDRKS